MYTTNIIHEYHTDAATLGFMIIPHIHYRTLKTLKIKLHVGWVHFQFCFITAREIKKCWPFAI
jgi:hypothetical protein